MSLYVTYIRGGTPVGATVVRLYTSGDEVKAFIRKLADADHGDDVFPGEGIDPELAFKVAEDTRSDPRHPVYIELGEGVVWNPVWGPLD